jgi:hypothetical protein
MIRRIGKATNHIEVSEAAREPTRTDLPTL